MNRFLLGVILTLFSGKLVIAQTIKVNVVGVDANTSIWSGREMISFTDTVSKAQIGVQIRSLFIPSPDKASLNDSRLFLENSPDYIIFMDDFHYHYFGPHISKQNRARIGFGSLYSLPKKFDKFPADKQFGVIQAPSHRNFELIKKYSNTNKFLMVGGPLAEDMGERLKELTTKAGFEKSEIFITKEWDKFKERIANTDRKTLTLILAPFEVYNKGKIVEDLEFANSINTCPSPSVTIKDIKHADPLFTLTASPEALGDSLASSLIKFVMEEKNPGIIETNSSGLTISRTKAKIYIKEFNSPEVVGFFRHH